MIWCAHFFNSGTWNKCKHVRTIQEKKLQYTNCVGASVLTFFLATTYETQKWGTEPNQTNLIRFLILFDVVWFSFVWAFRFSLFGSPYLPKPNDALY